MQGLSSSAVIAGAGSSLIEGGCAGVCVPVTCGSCDGNPGVGMRVEDGVVFYSGVQVLGGGDPMGSGCITSPPCDVGASIVTTGAGNAVPVAPPYPHLERSTGLPTGASVRFAVWGEPGDKVVLMMGARPALEVVQGSQIERLTSEDVAIPLGVIGPAGNVTRLMPVDFLAARFEGYVFHAQALVRRGVRTFRTNSVPVLIR